MNLIKAALLAGLICASVFAQDPSINTQVVRVYGITSTTATVEGLCTNDGSTTYYGVCSADFEYGTTLPFTQTAKGNSPQPATSGRTTGILTELPPDKLVFVRAVNSDGGVPVYSPMISFRTAKTDAPTVSLLYVTLWDDDCINSRSCVNAFWSITGIPTPSIFMVEARSNYTPALSEYVLVATADSCSNCRIPVEKGKNYTFVVVAKRTAETPSKPDSEAIAQFTYKAR